VEGGVKTKRTTLKASTQHERPFNLLKRLVPNGLQGKRQAEPARATDEEILQREMAGVRRLGPNVRKPSQAPPLDSFKLPLAEKVEIELAGLLRHLESFDPYRDESMMGLSPGVSACVLHKLTRGEFSIQAYLDLHGLTVDEARQAVRDFLQSSTTKGYRCVLIIHGKGRNSRDDVPVLKEKVRSWLSRGSIGKRVLAFSPARGCDGGGGAVTVLLKSPRSHVVRESVR
jgi:DNA-nicking Smr family endonuclease